VDNGSPDLLRTHADRLLLTVVSQPQRSKNRALNLGLRHARGELIVLTDDDFIVEPGWLPGYAAPWGHCSENHPSTKPRAQATGSSVTR
jgi:glycosyltransferase involved in cell wall biosynthesis